MFKLAVHVKQYKMYLSLITTSLSLEIFTKEIYPQWPLDFIREYTKNIV